MAQTATHPADRVIPPVPVRQWVISVPKRLRGFLDKTAAADMLAWEHSGFSVDASVRIALVDRDVPSYFKSLEHLLRYCAGPAFALERLSVVPGGGDARGGPAQSPERVRYALPRHKRGQWVGPGRSRKATAPGDHGVIDLSPEAFLDRLADLEPPPLAPARGPPTRWDELVHVHDDRDAIQASAGQASPDELPVIDIHSR